MKSIFITLSLITLCSCNNVFLRELAGELGEIASFTFTSSCIKSKTAPTSFKATTTATYDKTGGAATATLHITGASSTTNDLSYAGSFPDASSAAGAKEITFSTGSGTVAYGTYTVTSIALTSTSSSTAILDSATGNSLQFVEDFTIDSTQTASQQVNSTSTDKKTFTVKLTANAETAPVFYTNDTTPKPIPCDLDGTDKKKVVCTPTTTQMTANSNYTIKYYKPCETTLSDTGITVGFNLKESTDSSFTMTFSKLALVLALFLF